MSSPTDAYPPYQFVRRGDPVCSNFRRLDRLQAENRPFLRADEAQGYSVFTDHDVILDGLQHPELFSNAAMVPVEPDPSYKWIPIMLDPPDPHRCLGSHLGRQEMAVVLDEWRRLIPDYEVSDTTAVVEHSGGVYSLDRLPLRWKP